MKRSIVAFIGGLATWVVVVSLINRGLRFGFEGYALAEPALQFTLGMMAARLAMAAVTSVVAGAVTKAIAPASSYAPWALGVFLFVAFVPQHIWLWQSFPIWYHLTFLLTLVPLVGFGSWLLQRTRARTAPAP